MPPKSLPEVVDEDVEALVALVQELPHPLDVVRPQRDLQVAQHLRQRGKN